MAKRNDMTVTTLDMFNILKSKNGEREAQTLVEFVEKKISDSFDTKSDVLATKKDISILEIKIEKTKADIIKWMFIFWAGQTSIMIGILALFLK